jgi:hypothetical protein
MITVKCVGRLGWWEIDMGGDAYFSSPVVYVFPHHCIKISYEYKLFTVVKVTFVK